MACQATCNLIGAAYSHYFVMLIGVNPASGTGWHIIGPIPYK